mmetsp:Transcript_6478/g.27265  ORF Transcript_6478/g.27265 Transcript_6478/m.27265 type:complete len:252 (-) Transcript_6478:484-1239(-)
MHGLRRRKRHGLCPVVDLVEVSLQHRDVLVGRLAHVERHGLDPAQHLALPYAPPFVPRRRPRRLEPALDVLVEEHGVRPREERARRREHGGLGVEVVDDGAAVERRGESRVRRQKPDRRLGREDAAGVGLGIEDVHEEALVIEFLLDEVRVDLDDHEDVLSPAERRRSVEELGHRGFGESRDREVVCLLRRHEDEARIDDTSWHVNQRIVLRPFRPLRGRRGFEVLEKGSAPRGAPSVPRRVEHRLDARIQ